MSLERFQHSFRLFSTSESVDAKIITYGVTGSGENLCVPVAQMISFEIRISMVVSQICSTVRGHGDPSFGDLPLIICHNLYKSLF